MTRAARSAGDRGARSVGDRLARSVSAVALCGLTGVAAVAVVACGGPAEPARKPEPAVSALDRPEHLIPGDLDLVLRVDVARAETVLGPSLGRALELGVVDEKEDADVAALLRAGLERASTVWVAVRPGAAPALTDNVVVLRGNFRAMDKEDAASRAFSRPLDLGAALFRFDRERPKRRSAPSRLYARLTDLLVFVSEAEIDSVERAVEKGLSDPHLEPPSTGAISFAARARSLVPAFESAFPAIAELLANADQVEGSADLGDSGISASVEARFDEVDDAVSARRRAEELITALRDRSGLLAEVAKSLRSDVTGNRLVLSLRMDPANAQRFFEML